MLVSQEVHALGDNLIGWIVYVVEQQCARKSCLRAMTTDNFCNSFCLEQGFPTWCTCTPRGTFAYPKGYI